jgi:hypothetical protein
MSRTLAGLLREFNVEVVDNSRAWCRGARQTCAGRTLARIFELRGYDHLRSVVMSIVESKPNKKALIGPIIWAVSDVLHAYPEWMGATWLEVMDDINLVEMFERANRRIAQPRSAMATLIFERMRQHFPEPVRVGARRRRLPVEDEPAEMAA